MLVRLANETDLAGFRREARALLARGVPPAAVQWSAGAGGDLFALHGPEPAPQDLPAPTVHVPAAFMQLCEQVVLHREPQRFALLYRLLWRLAHEPTLRHDPLDADMLQAQHMAHAVRRDIHKMKANLKLRVLKEDDGRELQVGCYEPAHHVIEAVGPWLAKRIPAARWAIFTPERSVRCVDGALLYGPGVPSAELPGPDGSDADWLACYARVFAPHDRPAEHA